MKAEPRRSIAWIACAIAISCSGGCRSATTRPARDPHSHAEPDRVAVTHLGLDLTVDFATHVLRGTARLTLVRTDRSAPLVLDDDGLVVASAAPCAGGTPLAIEHGPVGNGGRALTIALPTGVDCVAIVYEVPKDAAALLWVDPAGTAGGVKPMLFTQSQAILARTWIPLQDSPSVRFTYDATMRVPADLMALMSAENPHALAADGVYTFHQTHPIPSYLMALAVGDFVFAPIGPRTGVYAEPSVAEGAAREFNEVELMIKAAEKLYGPYRWGRYDMLVLPASFPYGGMENPNLTFLTPTVITGDRALVSLIAHELAHSWSGNLATNATWNDAWLNEGTTTYVENRIMEELRGRDYADVLWWTSGIAIQRTIAEVSPLSFSTRLAHAFGSDVPVDEIPDDVIYDKGALFLRTLEMAYGRERFDAFLRGWFGVHAFQAVDTPTFVREAETVLGTKVDLGYWVYGTGLPPDAAPTTSARADMLVSAARALARTGTVPDASQWTSLDWGVFVRTLPDGLSRAAIDALDTRYALTTTKNPEIAMHWLVVLIGADAQDRKDAVVQYLMTVGRRRNILPVYEAMMARNEFWRDLARRTFDAAKDRYHPVTRRTVAAVLSPTQ